MRDETKTAARGRVHSELYRGPDIGQQYIFLKSLHLQVRISRQKYELRTFQNLQLGFSLQKFEFSFEIIVTTENDLHTETVSFNAKILILINSPPLKRGGGLIRGGGGLIRELGGGA